MKQIIKILLLFSILLSSCIKDDAPPFPVVVKEWKVLLPNTVRFTFSKPIDKKYAKDLSVFIVDRDRNYDYIFGHSDDLDIEIIKVKRAVIKASEVTLTLEKALKNQEIYMFRFKDLHAEDGGIYPIHNVIEVIYEEN